MNILLKYRLLASAVPLVLLVTSTIFTQLSSGNIKVYYQNLAEAGLKQQTFNEAENLNHYVEANLTALNQMSVALPSESMMVGVVQDFESVIRPYDPTATVKFEGRTPIKIGQDLVIPVTITLKSSPPQIADILTQLTGLPYITQLINLESQISADQALSIINLRLYVQEPYTGY